MAALAATLAALCVLCTGAIAGLGPNPADDPSLLRKHIEDPSYDVARRCTGRNDIPSGTEVLVDWLGRHSGRTSWGIWRCERLASDSFSLHSEGRAIDWAMDAREPDERRQAMALIRDMLLATDRA